MTGFWTNVTGVPVYIEESALDVLDSDIVVITTQIKNYLLWTLKHASVSVLLYLE